MFVHRVLKIALGFYILQINRTGGGGAKKFGGGAPTSNKCFVCSKTVYPMEKLEADKHVYHKFCFKCKTCNRTVGLVDVFS